MEISDDLKEKESRELEERRKVHRKKKPMEAEELLDEDMIRKSRALKWILSYGEEGRDGIVKFRDDWVPVDCFAGRTPWNISRRDVKELMKKSISRGKKRYEGRKTRSGDWYIRVSPDYRYNKGRKPCNFFPTKKGCRSGTECKYAHEVMIAGQCATCGSTLHTTEQCERPGGAQEDASSNMS